MSEVIVRMEMPNGCASCPMGDDEARFCKAAKEYIPMLGKPSWCPIIGELPEQHGDLVDADTVLWEEEVPDSEGIVVPVTIGDVIEGYDVQIVIAAERKDDGTTAD